MHVEGGLGDREVGRQLDGVVMGARFQSTVPVDREKGLPKAKC